MFLSTIKDYIVIFRSTCSVLAGLGLVLTVAVVPGVAETDFERGVELRIQGKLREALKAFREVSGDSDLFADALLQRGTILEDLGQTKRAVALYRRLLVLAPHNREAARNLRHLSAARSMRIPEPGHPRLQQALISRAMDDYLHGRIKKAEIRLRLVKGLFPDAPEPLFYEALILEGRGNEKQARTVLRNIMNTHPTFAPAVVHLIVSLLKSGRTKAALDVLDKGLSTLPTDPRLKYLTRLLKPAREKKVRLLRNELTGGLDR
jgi:tetratricopeptide (TPR) repeat protein